MDGKEFYNKAIHKVPGLASRFVFLTGDVVTGKTHDFIRSVNAPCVDKPFQLDSIRVAVNAILKSQGEMQDVY